MELLQLGSNLEGPYARWVGSYPVLAATPLEAEACLAVQREVAASLVEIRDPHGCLCDFFPDWCLRTASGEELWVSFWRREAVVYSEKSGFGRRYRLKRNANDDLYRRLLKARFGV